MRVMADLEFDHRARNDTTAGVFAHPCEMHVPFNVVSNACAPSRPISFRSPVNSVQLDGAFRTNHQCMRSKAVCSCSRCFVVFRGDRAKSGLFGPHLLWPCKSSLRSHVL
jgi:hypothetical protein